MKNSYLLIGAVLLILAIAYWGSREKEDGNESSDTYTNNAGTPPITTPNNSTPAATAVPVGAALNPAHGQPGHRCDLAVGAPLPTTANPLPATNTINPVATPAPAAPATVSSGAKNPEHGQPGHRCDIAVGAPLDSKPNAMQPVTSPAPQPMTGNSTTGRNPAHGQPNHRCDLPVGASFDSANAAKKQ